MALDLQRTFSLVWEPIVVMSYQSSGTFYLLIFFLVTIKDLTSVGEGLLSTEVGSVLASHTASLGWITIIRENIAEIYT